MNEPVLLLVCTALLLLAIAFCATALSKKLKRINKQLKKLNGDPRENQLLRRAQKDKMQTTQLQSCHTENCKLLPDRNVLLDAMPKNAVVAEIGAAFGDFSKEILSRCAPKQLHLVDAWHTPRYQVGLEKIKSDLSEDISSKRLLIHQGLSTDVLPTFADGTFDWVYIDTNHTYETTLEELLICDTKVGRDGRIAGHDFCTGNVVGAVPYGVVEAVTKFCKDRNWQFEYLTVESHGHFSFCLKRL